MPPSLVPLQLTVIARVLQVRKTVCKDSSSLMLVLDDKID